MGARFYDPYLARFLSPDTIIPQPENPQSLNRFSYAFGDPLIYRDPSGHSPKWLDWATGAFAQYVDDVSLGLFSALVGDLDDINNEVYQEGRKAGRVVSTLQASTETVQGVGAMATGLGASAPTLAAGAACTVGTGGACAVPAGVVLGAEGTAILGGAVEAAHGGLMLAKIASDPLAEAKDYGSRGGGGRPRGNQAQNKQCRGAVDQIEQELGRKLSYEEIDELHYAIQELEDPGFWDIVDEGLNLFDMGD